MNSLTPSGQRILQILTKALIDFSREKQGTRFTETQLREYIKQTAPRPLQIEVRVADDIPCTTTRGQRQIDYAWPGESAAPPFCLGDLAATCELKGPARPTILNCTTNWYNKLTSGEPRGIKPDAEKQRDRSKRCPETAHYGFWIVRKAKTGINITEARGRLFACLYKDVPDIHLTICAENDLGHLWLYFVRVDFARSARNL